VRPVTSLPEGANTIAGRSLDSREGRILATARDLLSDEFRGVWLKGYIDPHAAPYPPSRGEQIIINALDEAWRGFGTFGALSLLPAADRAAVADLLLEPVS